MPLIDPEADICNDEVLEHPWLKVDLVIALVCLMINQTHPPILQQICAQQAQAAERQCIGFLLCVMYKAFAMLIGVRLPDEPAHFESQAALTKV